MNADAPSTSSALPMIEPTIDALTTSCRPAPSAKRAMMSSGALPNVTFSRPPMPGPERSASSSVARPIRAAVGTTPRAEAKKTITGSAETISSRTASGMKGTRMYGAPSTENRNRRRLIAPGAYACLYRERRLTRDRSMPSNARACARRGSKTRLAPPHGAADHPLHRQGRSRQDVGGRRDRAPVRRGRPAHDRRLDRPGAQPRRRAGGAARGAADGGRRAAVGAAGRRAGRARAQLARGAGLARGDARRARRRPDLGRGADRPARARRALQPARDQAPPRGRALRRRRRRLRADRRDAAPAVVPRRRALVAREGVPGARLDVTLPGDSVLDDVQRLVRNLIAMNEILRDRDRVSIRLVMTPDRLVI